MAKRKQTVALKDPTGIEDTETKVKPETSHGITPNLDGVAERVAGCLYTTKNYRIPNAEEHFPHEPLLRRIDKYFRSEELGELFIDQPSSREEIAGCERKAKVMQKLGLRYAYVTKDMDEGDLRRALGTEDAA